MVNHLNPSATGSARQAPARPMTASQPALVSDGWLFTILTPLAILNVLPFLAPVLMQVGQAQAADVIYGLYSLLCHQMAQRSLFLFGPQGIGMYNLADLPVDIGGLSLSQSMSALRAFYGNASLGWKVAWSDRMVYMYATLWLVTVIYWLIRQRGWLRPLPVWAFGLLLLPMLLDGGSHWVSDLAGIGQGFRDSNQWLARLTNYSLPGSFYAGDALGSFNSLLRLSSGLTFGLAVGWFVYPRLDLALARSVQQSQADRPLEVLFQIDPDLSQIVNEPDEE